MKVVILCGGQGTRLREETEFKPKPLVTVGGIPIIWHIMKMYSSFGHKNFVLCLGYKGWMIKDFFLNYRWKRNDFTLDLGKSGAIEHYERSLEDWKITFADTGKKTNTAGRILISRKYLDEKRFMMTYGDGVSDINFDKLLQFHEKKGKIATISCTRATSKYGLVMPDDEGLVTDFKQKPILSDLINIGFAVFENEIFNYINKDCPIEDVFPELIKDGQLGMYQHNGFFHSMDTYKDYQDLNNVWNSNNVPWKIWNDK